MDTLLINRPLTVLTYFLIKLLIYWYLIISYFLTCFLTYLFNYLPDRLSCRLIFFRRQKVIVFPVFR